MPRTAPIDARQSSRHAFRCLTYRRIEVRPLSTFRRPPSGIFNQPESSALKSIKLWRATFGTTGQSKTSGNSESHHAENTRRAPNLVLGDREKSVPNGTTPHKPGSNHLDEFATLLPSKIKYHKSRSHKQRVREVRNHDAPQEDEPHDGQTTSSGDWKKAFLILKKATPTPAHNDSHHSENIYRHVASQDRRIGQAHKDPPSKPSVWTQASFAIYVEAIASYEPPGKMVAEILRSRAVKRAPLTRNDQINILEKTFNNPYLRNCVSVHAGEVYLKFLYQQSLFKPARSLFTRLEYLFTDLPTSTWNVKLRASATRKDLSHFIFCLKRMVAKEVSPDFQTWISFLMATDSADVRREVIDTMEAKGLMNSPKALRQVARHMCLIEYKAYQELKAEKGSFFDFMDRRYDRDWASTSTINGLLAEIMLRPTSGPRIAALYEGLVILHQMKQRTFAADSATMDIFLKCVISVGREDIIVRVLEIFQIHWKLKPDRQIHWRLFRYGWNRQKYNFLRTVWASACLEGFTTAFMRYLVLQSMLAYKRTSTAEPIANQSFHSAVGWFLTSLHTTDSVDRLIGPDSDVVPQEQCFLAMKSNIASLGQGRLQRSLPDDLRHALELDSKWDFYRVLGKPDKGNALVRKGGLQIVRSKPYKTIGYASVKKLNRNLRRKRNRLPQQSRATIPLQYPTRKVGGLKDTSILRAVKSQQPWASRRLRSIGFRFRQTSLRRTNPKATRPHLSKHRRTL